MGLRNIKFVLTIPINISFYCLYCEPHSISKSGHFVVTNFSVSHIEYITWNVFTPLKQVCFVVNLTLQHTIIPQPSQCFLIKTGGKYNSQVKQRDNSKHFPKKPSGWKYFIPIYSQCLYIPLLRMQIRTVESCINFPRINA